MNPGVLEPSTILWRLNSTTVYFTIYLELHLFCLYANDFPPTVLASSTQYVWQQKLLPTYTFLLLRDQSNFSTVSLSLWIRMWLVRQRSKFPTGNHPRRGPKQSHRLFDFDDSVAPLY